MWGVLVFRKIRGSSWVALLVYSSEGVFLEYDTIYRLVGDATGANIRSFWIFNLPRAFKHVPLGRLYIAPQFQTLSKIAPGPNCE
jgi:hypothetical protein